MALRITPSQLTLGYGETQFSFILLHVDTQFPPLALAKETALSPVYALRILSEY